MSSWLISATRACGLVLRMILLACLVNWVLAAPLVWILRDGLAPGMVETEGLQAAYKFLVLWSIPASLLAIPLLVLWYLDRRLSK